MERGGPFRAAGAPAGRFVGEFQLDGGAPGAAFGIAVSTDNGVLRVAAVDDTTNTVHVWTLQDPPAEHEQGRDHGPADRDDFFIHG